MHPALALRALDGLDRQIVQILIRNPDAGSNQSQIARHLGSNPPSQSTISRSLSRLADAGIIAKTGATRNASFRLTTEAAWFALPDRSRSRIAYDPERIGSYDAEKGPWLPEKQAMAMRAAASTGGLQLDAGTYAREIAERFMIEMSWASSALEGNTYSLIETEVLIKYAEKAVGRSAEEATMILNHKDAIGWLLENIDTVQIDATTAFRLHALLMRGLVNQVNLGSIRQHAVGITNTAYSPSEDRVELTIGLSELCVRASQAVDPFEASFALLIGTAYLQAFADGNKRLGRLMSSLPLLKAGLPPHSFVGTDRQAYSAGMISWYELADPSHIAQVVAEGYALTAPAYKVSSVSRRIPRSVEIRERFRFDAELVNFMKAYAEGNRKTPADHAEAAFAHLNVEDRVIISDSFWEVIEAMDDIKAVAYGIPKDVFESYQTARNSRIP